MAKASESDEEDNKVAVLEEAVFDLEQTEDLPLPQGYQGETKDGGVKHGKGVLMMSSGARYEGNFQDNMMEGSGTFVWPSQKYVGDFHNGRMHGYGIFIDPNGVKYEGEWKNGRKHGKGVELFPTGAKYVGHFESGKRNGKGAYTWPNKSHYQGEFGNGKIHGEGS